MYKVFDFPRMVNGKPERDMVILNYPRGVDLNRVFHKLGLECCMNAKNPNDLLLSEFMKYVTPEMLAPYGIEMLRPNDIAVRTDGAAPIINRYELETYQEARNYGDYQVKKVYKIAKQLVGRLETKRTHGHPAISTWGPGRISDKAFTWAEQFVYGNETDLTKFFEKKLQEARPHSSNKAQSPVDTDMVNDFSEGQRAEHISQ